MRFRSVGGGPKGPKDSLGGSLRDLPAVVRPYVTDNGILLVTTILLGPPARCPIDPCRFHVPKESRSTCCPMTSVDRDHCPDERSPISRGIHRRSSRRCRNSAACSCSWFRRRTQFSSRPAIPPAEEIPTRRRKRTELHAEIQDRPSTVELATLRNRLGQREIGGRPENTMEISQS